LAGCPSPQVSCILYVSARSVVDEHGRIRPQIRSWCGTGCVRVCDCLTEQEVVSNFHQILLYPMLLPTLSLALSFAQTPCNSLCCEITACR
jgi:hypothetical protein